MSNITELKNVPELSFLGDTTLESLVSDMKTKFNDVYSAETGESYSFANSDPNTIILNAAALQLYQAMASADENIKQNFLKYATGSSLDNLGALKGVTREAATNATCALQFTLSDAQTADVTIPGGTRVSTESGTIFITDEAITIAAGNLTGSVSATAEEAGSAASGLAIGTVDVIVDEVAYVESVSNTSVTSGGADIESDDDYTLDIFNAPKGTSMGGPETSYEALALKMSSSVAEAKAVSPTACNILVYFMMSGGVIPSTDQITAMTAWFSPKSRRPQGDRVTCAAPSEVTYDITMTYYIDAADEASESTITAAVNAAITSYETWQRVMGRDINPSQLIKMVMAAGAKRVVLTAPVHTVINNGADDSADPVQIAKLGTATITNGGLEND